MPPPYIGPGDRSPASESSSADSATTEKAGDNAVKEPKEIANAGTQRPGNDAGGSQQRYRERRKDSLKGLKKQSKLFRRRRLRPNLIS